MNAEIAKQITDLKQAWDALQPLESTHEARFWQKLRLDWNYNSNHLEGNTLTYGETQLLLIKGETKGGHKIREYQEMQAHDVAIGHVRSLASDSRPITEADVRDLNQILLKEPFWKDAITADGQPTRKQVIPGQYKSTPNNVKTSTGELFFFATPEETPARMADLVNSFRDGIERGDMARPDALAKFHHDFSIIHPFDDGNGRTMRLLVNYALIRAGYPPIVIKSLEKQKYLAALNLADAGDLEPFVEFLAEKIISALELGIRAARGESIEEPQDWEKEMSMFIQEHLVEETPAPERTWEMLLARWSDSWRRVSAAIDDKLHPLAKIFAKIEISIIPPPTTGEESKLEKERHRLNWAYTSQLAQSTPNGDPNQIFGFGWRISLEGYSGSGCPPFETQVEFFANFDRYRYQIEKGPFTLRPVSKLRYDQPITAEQIQDIATTAGKAVFDTVQMRVRAQQKK